jgi:hypothetical protein
MLADRNALAIPAAEEAMARAKTLGRWDIYMQAQTHLRTAQASTDLDAGLPAIRATITEARERGELDELPRLYTNLTAVMSAGASGTTGCWRPPTRASRYARRATRDRWRLTCAATARVALLDLGRIDEAMAEAEQVVHGPYPRMIVSLSAMIALSRRVCAWGLPRAACWSRPAPCRPRSATSCAASRSRSPTPRPTGSMARGRARPSGWRRYSTIR